MSDNADRYAHGDIECIDAIRAALTPEEFRDGSSTKPFIRCSVCGCRTYGSHDLKKLAAIWNRRSGE